MVKQKRALHALLLVIGVLSLAALACTSDQDWIIPRTPTPTVTPTPIPVTTQSMFEVGDSAKINITVFSLPLTQRPEPDTGGNRQIGTNCFKDQIVEILDIAQGEDGSIYYLVNCTLDGWTAETNLAPAE